MAEILDRIIELSREGYCCSQIIFLLAQDMHQNAYDDIVKAMGGLCMGMHTMGYCGTLSGACCLISYYTGTGRDYKDNPAGKLMIKELVHWFQERFGNTGCRELVGEYSPKQEQFCAGLIGECFSKTMEILEEYGVDIYMEG